MSVKFRGILFLWCLILLLYIGNSLTTFSLSFDKITNKEIPIDNNIVISIVIIMFVVNFLMILLQILIFSIGLYIISVIIGNRLSKIDCLYIMSLTILTNILSLIPISIMNLVSTNTMVSISHNYIYILLNPFLLLSMYVLYRLLKKWSAKNTMIATSLIVYYVFQIVSQIINFSVMS